MPVLHATNDERIYRARSSTRTARQTGSDPFERPQSAAVLAPLPYINVREGQKVTREFGKGGGSLLTSRTLESGYLLNVCPSRLYHIDILECDPHRTSWSH